MSPQPLWYGGLIKIELAHLFWKWHTNWDFYHPTSRRQVEPHFGVPVGAVSGMKLEIRQSQ